MQVHALDLRPGGELVNDIATGPEQIQFMQGAGLPLTSAARKTFTELTRPTLIAYTSLVDFVPGVDSYEFLTVVDLEDSPEGVRVVMQVHPMHDDEWTQRLLMGRENELDNLARVIERGRR